MTPDSSSGRCAVVCTYRHPLLKKINPFFRSLHGMADPTVTRKVQFNPLTCAMAAVLMAWDMPVKLATRWFDALGCLGFKQPDATQGSLGCTYNGLSKALVRQAPTIIPRLQNDLRKQIRERWNKIPRVGRWHLLAVDGSKIQLPATASCEKHFGIADNGQVPQALVSCIVEVFTGLLWDWVVDRGDGDEKSHLRQMSDTLPTDALLLADANFVGHQLWSTLMAAGCPFLIRVGGNIRLLENLWPALRFTGEGQIVYAWPKAHQSQVEPLTLRLIKVGCARKPVYLLSNVLDDQQLSSSLASRAYRMRWGVELFYRSLKRTLGAAKVTCRNADRARVQLHWTLVSQCVLTLMGLEHLPGKRLKSRRLSLAKLLSAVRQAMLGRTSHTTQQQIHQQLTLELQNALTDQYKRRSSKASRHRPRVKNTPTLKLQPPIIRQASKDEQDKVRINRAMPKL
tara:strand:- start:189 stop:1553 length:1365 start_codon:yes stop_codon:yes gene_type:complete